MTSENSYLRALRKGAPPHELHVLELEIVKASSMAYLIELLQTEISDLQGKRARLHQLTLVHVRLATILAAKSKNDTSPTALRAAMDAARIWGHTLNDAEKAKRMHLRALWLAGIHFPDTLDQAMDAANGPQAALHLLRQTIQNGDDKSMDFSRILLDILQNHGAPKKIFLEALKAIRKWPHNSIFHLKVRAYAELTNKVEEALFTLNDLLNKNTDNKIIQSLILESIGRMKQIMQEDDAAFDAYHQALTLNPNRGEAWHYGKQLAEKLERTFTFEQPKSETFKEGLAVTASPTEPAQATVRSRSPISQESTLTSKEKSLSIHSLDEEDILELQSLPPSNPPPLPEDSDDQPPMLPPSDSHDDFDHVWQADRQRLAMDAALVSEVQPLQAPTDTATQVSVPSWDVEESETSYNDATEIQPMAISETSTQVGFGRGPLIDPNSSTQERALAESNSPATFSGPSPTLLEMAIETENTQMAFELLKSHDPENLSAIWRSRLFQTLLNNEAGDFELKALHHQAAALLEEGFADVVQWITIFFNRLNERDRLELGDLWGKTLALLSEDQAIDKDLMALIIAGAAQQKHLTEKVFVLASRCEDTALKQSIYEALLPLWPHESGVEKTYNQLAKLTEAFPAAYFAVCDEWAHVCPESLAAQEALLAAAQQEGKTDHIKMALERLLTLSEVPSRKAVFWIALSDHYWLQSPDYWKEAANACAQAIGHEPGNTAHWIAFILKCQNDLQIDNPEDAKALLEKPSEPLLKHFRNYLDPILLELALDNESLPKHLRRITGLLMAITPKDPTISCDVLAALLDDFSDDLPLLEAYAHLLAKHGMHPPQAEKNKLNPLELILSNHAASIDTMKQISLWGDLGTVRWSAGDSSGALSAFQKLFGLLQHDIDNPQQLIPDRFLDTAFTVLNAPEHKEMHTDLLIATLEMKAQRQSEDDASSSLKRALALAAKHDPAKAKELFSQIPIHAFDVATLQSGKKAYDNLDQLEAYCAHLRHRIQNDSPDPKMKALLLEALAEIEGQLLRNPEAAAEALIELANAKPDDPTRHAQAADLLMEAGELTKAIAALRQCILQDLYNQFSWQKLFLCAQKTDNDSLLLQTGAAMVALGLASDELKHCFEGRTIPPYQTPTSPPNPNDLKALITHPLINNHAASLIEQLSRQVHRLFGKSLSEVGLLQQHRLQETQLSANWYQSLNVMYQVLRFEEKLPLFENHRHMALDAILAPTAPPALVLQPSAKTAAITPMGTFFLARAIYWAQPSTRLLALLSLDELRGVLTALRAHLLRKAHPGAVVAALRMGQKICRAYLKKIPVNAQTEHLVQLTGFLQSLERQDERKEIQKHLQGVSLSSNRLGLLMTGDIIIATQSLDLLHKKPLIKSRMLAYRDLVGFGISEGLHHLRTQMGMVADPVLVNKLNGVTRVV